MIFLDLMMPEIIGDVSLKEIRDLGEKWGVDHTDETKVITVTALHDRSHVVEAIQNECDAYSTNPFDKKKF